MKRLNAGLPHATIASGTLTADQLTRAGVIADNLVNIDLALAKPAKR